mgnify:CR=1 FL=1
MDGGFLRNYGTGGSNKEESSDESTIISSQTSTLTRNEGPEGMASHVEGDEEGEIFDSEDEDEEGAEDYTKTELMIRVRLAIHSSTSCAAVRLLVV